VNTPKEVDLEDDETPEVRVQPAPGELGAQIKHFLRVLTDHRGNPEYRDKIKDFLAWFPDDKLEGYLMLSLEYAVDRVSPRGKGRGGRGNPKGGSKRP
jgi:hypothetical protein